MNQTIFALRNFKDKIDKGMRSKDVLIAYWQTYVMSRFQSVEPDVYIVSYPKCGRTWLKLLILQYLEMTGYSPHYFYDQFLFEIPGKEIIKFDHDQGNWVPAPLRPDQIKFNSSKYAGKSVVFLVRDPRDVLVSSWYHLKYRERIFLQDLSIFIRDNLIGIHKIITFMNLWMMNRSIPGRFLLITYEQMHKDPVSVFEHLLNFLSVQIDQRALIDTVEKCSFQKMKRMELQGTLKEPWMKPGVTDLDQAMKIRKGKVGGFQEELSNDDILYLNEVIRDELTSQLPYSQEL